MSRFYGKVYEPGSTRTASTRCGHRSIRTSSQSYDGSIICELTYDENDKLNVYLGCNEGSSSFASKTLYQGSFEDLQKTFELLSDIKSGKVSTIKHRAKSNKMK